MNTNAHQLTDHVDRTAAIISVNPTPHVVIEYDGNRVKAIHGPFESADAAMAAGNRTIDAPWGTHPLTPPEPDDRVALCSSCGWSGAVTATVPSNDFELEYGDLVPVGRCPECDVAAYEAEKFAELIVTPDQYLVLDTLETVVGFDANPRREVNGELVFDWGDVTYRVAEEGTLTVVELIAPSIGNLNRLQAALKRIRHARDYCAEHGHYPPGVASGEQDFDDWAADVADKALQSAMTAAHPGAATETAE